MSKLYTNLSKIFQKCLNSIQKTWRSLKMLKLKKLSKIFHKCLNSVQKLAKFV